MKQAFAGQPEEAYQRRTLFAIELLDSVTLSRVTGLATKRSELKPGQGVIVADGLQGAPIVNASGFFVWLQEDISRLRKVLIDPGALPYEVVELEPPQLNLPPNPRPLTTIELAPRVDYSFAAGITGLRGRLIEERVTPARPVAKAEVRLQWLDEDDFWRDAPIRSHTNFDGDFASILRLAPTDAPKLDGNRFVTTRLRVSRDGGVERSSDSLKLLQGRVTDPSALDPLTFAWDDLHF
jgi:hypothetical protein